jgi:NAD(P)-dependent dehydrogenase (short-subunit alcohol dehydrogenase family)
VPAALVCAVDGRLAGPSHQSAKWAVAGFSEVLAREVAPLNIRVTCVEPGGMRTDMFGLSMLAPVAPDYEATVDRFIRATFGRADAARNDPVRVARAILRLADEKQPPVRLLLGSDAVALAAAATAARAEEDARWKALSLSTEYDGLGEFAAPTPSR